MESVRLYLTRHRTWAMWLIAVAIFVKAVVPVGYMPVLSHGALVFELCSGFGPERVTMAMPGMGDLQGGMDHSGKGPAPCGFDGHAAPSLTHIDPVVLAIAIAFIIATVALAGSPWPVLRVSFLRPPLRGPPTID